jgi:alkanesulfonate monooxygenase SsuD/methylene tetrahydromethanopterin reductase-like flavin-dependent oxidoreductase (luciferase family)
MELGLFDILQIDPMDPRDHGQVYDRKLADLEMADQLGFHYYFTAERHFMPQFRCPAATPWIAAVSQRTKTMRLGVMAYTLPIQAPVALAEDIVVLDWLTGGRFEAGLGLGHRIEELQALGVDPGQRIPIFQERAAVLQALWTGGQVSVDSEYTTIKGAAISPLPVQQPHPPLWFAGSDPQAATWAGSIGMSLALGFKPVEALAPAAKSFKDAVAYRNNANPERRLPREGRLAMMRQVYIAETDDRAVDEMTDDVYRLHAFGAAEGGRPSRKEEARHAVEEMIRDEVFMAGSPDTIAAGIGKLQADLGVDVFLANIYASAIDQQRIERALRLLAGEVAGRVGGEAKRRKGGKQSR